MDRHVRIHLEDLLRHSHELALELSVFRDSSMTGDPHFRVAMAHALGLVQQLERCCESSAGAPREGTQPTLTL